MEWILYPENKPTESRPYTVSITGPYASGDFTLIYIAYYNAETNEWFKNDPFKENSVGEKINLRINGWLKGIATLIR
jgi:hypothetical protein